MVVQTQNGIVVHSRYGRYTIDLEKLSLSTRELLLSLPSIALQKIVETYLTFDQSNDIHNICFPSLVEILDGVDPSNYASSICYDTAVDVYEELAPRIWSIINYYRFRMLAKVIAIAIRIKN